MQKPDWVSQKQGKKIAFGRELTAKEKAKKKVREKPFSQMSRAEKDELLELALKELGIIE